MKKTFNIISYITLLVAFFLIVILGYWLFYPYNIITWENPKFEILTPVVKPGEGVKFKSDYCKSMDISATVSRAFVDGVVTFVPTSVSSRETGCHEVVVVVPVPTLLPDGEYYLQTIYEYRVNPIRTITIIRNTTGFKIVK